MADVFATTARHCAHPGCPAQFDVAAAMLGEASPAGWTQYVPHTDYYCPVHQDSPVPAAVRRLAGRHGDDWLAELLRHDGPWELGDLRDVLTCCPTLSRPWRRVCAEALARIDRKEREHG